MKSRKMRRVGHIWETEELQTVSGGKPGG